MTNNKHPFVSVIVAVRNEEKYIRECLDSLIAQDYLRDRYEVLIVDGRSADGTREIVEGYAKTHPNIKLVDNPRVNAAAGRNIGIKEARGEVLIMFSGHARAEGNFISTLTSKLAACDSSVAGVGCGHETPPDAPFIAKSIGLVMGSRFGGYGTTFPRGGEERFVDSIAFTAYRREIFERVGLHDERFVVGQDGELNLRIKKAGYRLLYTPKTMAHHHKKDSLSKFSKQMFNYGVARAKMIRKHPDTSRALYFMPSLFVLALIFLSILSLFIHVVVYPFLVVICAYFVCALISSAAIAWKHGVGYLALPIVYFIEHAAYGLGFLWGIRR